MIGVVICFIALLIVDPGTEGETFGLPLLWTGTFYGLPAIIIYLIVRSNKKKAFIEYYVSKKILEQMNKDK